ncbi:DUF4817 domain-containing protein [Trichonephila clavipes]|nr:DUF4817 domain-containing protein [Trichonephila clavipes]
MTHTSNERAIETVLFARMCARNQNDAPPHWHLSVRDCVNITVHNQWIVPKEPPDKACIAWLPISPDLTSCDFKSIKGFIKDCVYVPLLPDDLPDLTHRMEAQFVRISLDTLKKVCDEPAYRLDLCRVVNGAHVEHL